MCASMPKRPLTAWSRNFAASRGALWLLVLGVCLLGACGTQVSRVSVEETIDLSGRWNDTDSRLVAEAMIQEALSQPWIDAFRRTHGRKPTVVVGTIVNRSHEHINVDTFVKDLERELTRSGLVQFVAGRGEREEIREERLEQARHARPDTAKPPGHEIGADFLLRGTINSIVDEEGRTRVVFYQVDLELVDLETNVKVWFGQKKIKKVISRSPIRF